jgi:hypothetical protein
MVTVSDKPVTNISRVWEMRISSFSSTTGTRSCWNLHTVSLLGFSGNHKQQAYFRDTCHCFTANNNALRDFVKQNYLLSFLKEKHPQNLMLCKKSYCSMTFCCLYNSAVLTISGHNVLFAEGSRCERRLGCDIWNLKTQPTNSSVNKALYLQTPLNLALSNRNCGNHY